MSKRPPCPEELAHAYVPVQEYGKRYSPEAALQKGTIFPELYQPYRKGERYCNRDEEDRD